MCAERSIRSLFRQYESLIPLPSEVISSAYYELWFEKLCLFSNLGLIVIIFRYGALPRLSYSLIIVIPVASSTTLEVEIY
ncbi:hypothetical protein HanRHA438_Chr11g0501941 [Helianthus annuus]|nr:hypothetical protein HanRHA438_Chr11g0501941 [Helianthus annuus]